MLSMLGPKNFQVVRSINHLSMPCSGVSFNQRHGSIHGYQRHVSRHCTIYKRSPLLTSLHSTCQELNRSPPSNHQELLFDLVPSSLIHSYRLFFEHGLTSQSPIFWGMDVGEVHFKFPDLEMSITGNPRPIPHDARCSGAANMILELGKKAEEKGQNDNWCKVASWELVGVGANIRK